MDPQKAYEQAKRSSPHDVAALLLSASHVAARLRDVATEARDGSRSGMWLAARLDGLAAQLHAGLVERPVLAFVERYAARLAAGEVPAEGGAA